MAAEGTASSSPYIAAGGSAWRLAVADVDGDGSGELVCGTYGGDVRCLNPRNGRVLWRTGIGGFPFAVATADVNGDGKAETLVAASDGKLYAFGPDGKTLWEFGPTNAAMNAVAVCRQGPGSSPVILCGGFSRTLYALGADGKEVARLDFKRTIHQLVAADVDGDGRQEAVLTGYKDRNLHAMQTRDGALRRLWRRPLPTVARWGRKSAFVPYSAVVADLDGDGREEVVFGTNYGGGSKLIAIGAKEQPLWITPRWRGASTDGFERQDMFNMTLVAAGNVLPGRPGKEIVAVTTGSVRLYGSDGKLLGQAHAPVGFTDVVLDGSVAYLGSSPNGDETIYRVDFSGDWKGQVASLTRQGVPKRIGESLAALWQRVMAYKGTAPAGSRYLVRSDRMPPKPIPRAPATRAWFTEQYPYDCLVHVTQCGSLSTTFRDPYVLDAGGKPVQPLKKSPQGVAPEDVVAWARRIEAAGIPTDLHIDHGCNPRIRLETLKDVIAASPNALVGFMSHEDEHFARIEQYCSEYLGPLSDLCRPAGKQITMQEKNVWWFAAPAMRRVYDGLFANGRGLAVAAGCDNANSRTPELNLLGRFGLRQAGLIGHIQMSTISDMFCWSRMREWEYPKHGHPYLRVLVAGTVLGADRFYVRVDNLHGGKFTAMAREGAGLFFHMLGKGIVFPPRPEQMVGVSRVGFAVHEPPAKWLANNTSGHAVDSWLQDGELDQAVVPHSSVVWGNTPTPPHSLQAVLLHKKRQFGAHVPATPYGPFVFVPAAADLKKVPFVEEWWHTDGISIWRDGGPKLTGQAAGKALRKFFEAAAAKLPFRAVGDDVFFHTIELAPGHWRLFAIDPGWLDPADRRIAICVQVAGGITLRDLLGGERLDVVDGEAKLFVPAGCLRIIDAAKQ